MNSGSLFHSRINISCAKIILAILAVGFLPGCEETGGDSLSSHEDAPAAPSSKGPVLDLQTASSTGGVEIKTASMRKFREDTTDYSVPVSGTPEWDLHQIALLLAEDSRQAAKSQSQQPTTTLNIVSKETARRIVAIASHAISMTHSRPEKEPIFNAAVQSLMDARLKLALAGEKESVDAIYEDAVTLAKERPGSAASTMTAAAVVRLAQEMARAEGSESPWISEYVRQTKLFSTNFPEEEARSIIQLTSAGEFCEQRQLILPAIECYTMIQQQFPNSPFRRKADAALRRLGLIGKKVALNGPTVDGGTFQLSEKEGRPVMLVFWSAKSDAFRQDVKLLNQLVAESHFQMVGINMDTDEATVKQFIETNHLAGEHIFYGDLTLQGASQPMARQFGINVVPTYWYIDEQGTVLATNVSREQLKSFLGR